MREPIIHYSSPDIDHPPPLADNSLQKPIHSFHYRYAKHRFPSILIIPHDASLQQPSRNTSNQTQNSTSAHNCLLSTTASSGTSSRPSRRCSSGFRSAPACF